MQSFFQHGPAGVVTSGAFQPFAQGCGFLPQGREQRGVDEFRQMQQKGLPRAHEGEKLFPVQLFRDDAQLPLQFVPPPAVPQVEHGEDMPFHPGRSFPALFHETAHAWLGQKGQKALRVGKAARDPDEVDQASPVGGVEQQADTDGHTHDFRRFHKLAGGFGTDEMIVDDREGADALDPGVHDQMGGVLAALGVGVMHMMIEHGLVPLFRHFQQKIAAQHAAYHGRLARRGLAEVMGKAELAFIVALGAHDFLHDLDQHPPRIAAQIRSCADHDFFPQGAQGMDALFFLPLFKRVQQTQHGGGHAHFRRNGQIDDAVGMQGVGMREHRRVFRAVQFDGPFDLGKKHNVLCVEAQ